MEALIVAEQIFKFDKYNVEAHVTVGSVYYNYKSCKMANHHYKIALTQRKFDDRVTAFKLSKIASDCFDLDLALDLIVNATDLESISSQYFIDIMIRSLELVALNTSVQLGQSLIKLINYQNALGRDIQLPKYASWLTLYVAEADAQTRMIAHQNYAQQVYYQTWRFAHEYFGFKKFEYKQQYLVENDKFKMKIGYATPDFGKQSALHDQLFPIILFHDKEFFELHFFHLQDSNPYTEEIKELKKYGTYHQIGYLNDYEAAKYINNCGIDILIDNKGHSYGNRLGVFSLQPAPVQISILSYPHSTGASYFQYILGDHLVIDEINRKFITENVIYMPSSYFTVQHKYKYRDCIETSQNRPSRRQMGIPRNAFVFGIFNQYFQIDSLSLETWFKIKEQVPGSILLFILVNKEGQQAIVAKARQLEIDLNEVYFLSQDIKSQVNVNRMFTADLALDTLQINARIVNTDLLWSGVPLLTLKSDSWANRVGASMLSGLGLSEQQYDSLVATTVQQYIQKAVDLAIGIAGSPQELDQLGNSYIAFERYGSLKLKQIRVQIEKNRETCSLFNSQEWTNHYEKGLKEVWRLHIQENKYKDIDVKRLN
eukprot:403362723